LIVQGEASLATVPGAVNLPGEALDTSRGTRETSGRLNDQHGEGR
jgi:hypothetical protein